MSVQQIYVLDFPAKVAKKDLNSDIVEFHKKGCYEGWLTQKAVMNFPLVKQKRISYYLIEREFLEPPTFQHIPQCVHEDFGWIWSHKYKAWVCCLCGILIHDPEMREVDESGYESWRRS